MNWNWKEDLKRGMAGLLAFTMASLLVVGDTGTVLAGLSAGGLLRDGVSLSEDSDISDSLVDSVTFENQENDGVLISVSSDDSDFQPGDDVTLHIYVKNESDETITGGILSYDGDGIQKGTGDLTLLGKLDSRDLLGQLLVESDETEDADLIWDLDEDSDAVILASENDWEWEEDIEAERDGITLEPGEIYVAQFEYVVDKSADGKTAEGFQIDFRFEGIGEDEDEIEAEETFSFTTNYLNVMAPEFEDGNLVKTGETIEMGLHANLAQADSVLTDSWEDASASDAEEAEEDVSVATPSQATAAASSAATTATASNASASTTVSVATPSQASAAKKATASDAVASDSDADEADATVDEELIDDRESMLTEVDLSEVRYEVEMYNAKLNGFKVKKAMVEDAENNMLVCTYRVSKEVEPGIYFGKVTQISEANGHTYESTQGFALIVEGDGDVTLEGSLGDTTVTVTGPVDAFPDADELEVRVTELDEETQLKVEEAIQRKAEEAGETLQNYIAMDVSLYADGEEIQPGERVEVTIAYDEEALTGTIATDEMEAADDALSESTTIKKAVYHFDEGSQEAEILDGSIEDGTATVTTMGFSPIVVAASLTATNDQGTLGEKLDGDYAYLTNVAMVEDETTTSGYSMRTGTASFDTVEGDGNDTTDLDDILRTYDVATYTVTFTSRTRDDAPYKTYETGTLYFEFILEGDSSKAQFEEGSMGWLTAKKGRAVCGHGGGDRWGNLSGTPRFLYLGTGGRQRPCHR